MHGASIQHGSCSPLGGAGWSEQSCPMWRAVASLLPQLPAPVPGSPEVGGGALEQSRGRAALDPAAPWCLAFLAPVKAVT